MLVHVQFSKENEAPWQRKKKLNNSQSVLMMQSKKKKKSQFVHTPPNIRTQTRTHSHAHPPTDTHTPTADAHAHTTKHLTEPPRISTSPDPSPANAAPNAAPSYRVLNFDRQLPLQSVVAGGARGGSLERQTRLGQQRHYTLQHCFLLALELTVGATDIVCTLPLGELSSSGLSRICFWETIL